MGPVQGLRVQEGVLGATPTIFVDLTTKRSEVRAPFVKDPKPRIIDGLRPGFDQALDQEVLFVAVQGRLETDPRSREQFPADEKIAKHEGLVTADPRCGSRPHITLTREISSESRLQSPTGGTLETRGFRRSQIWASDDSRLPLDGAIDHLRHHPLAPFRQSSIVIEKKDPLPLCRLDPLIPRAPRALPRNPDDPDMFSMGVQYLFVSWIGCSIHDHKGFQDHGFVIDRLSTAQ